MAGATPIGNYYISSSTQFEEITDFVKKIKQLGLGPQYIVAKAGEEFSLVISGDGEIYFDMKEPLSKAEQNLEALLRIPELAKNIAGIMPVDYIDLRYGNKLFYKLKN